MYALLIKCFKGEVKAYAEVHLLHVVLRPFTQFFVVVVVVVAPCLQKNCVEETLCVYFRPSVAVTCT